MGKEAFEHLEEEEGMQHFVDYIRKQGLVIVEESRLTNLASNKIPMKSGKHGKNRDLNDNESVITIYKNAVHQSVISDGIGKKRDSSSSDEPLATSEEIEQFEEINLQPQLIVRPDDIVGKEDNQQLIPGGVSAVNAALATVRHTQDRCYQQQEGQNVGRAEQMIWEAEASRARIYKVPGKPMDIQNEVGYEINNMQPLAGRFPVTPIRNPVHAALLDEDYLLVGNYIDKSIRKKIGNGEYVDYSKLLPKDRTTSEEDNRMEMVNKGGMSYWVPVSDREGVSISSYGKWEQAFRVFSNVYNEYFPGKAGELIQYNHVIHTASQTFLWENVYKYDREFRIHIRRHHLKRSWSVILQQAWSMFLKDKVNPNYSRSGGSSSSNNGGNQSARKRICFNFNRGDCSFARKCRFDHWCSFCFKYGHGSFNCHKTMKGHNNAGEGKQNNTNNDKNRWDRYEKNINENK